MVVMVVLFILADVRFKLFEGDAGNIDDLAAWVDAAVGASLPQGVEELLLLLPWEQRFPN